MENQHQESLPVDNMDKLKEQVKMAGFNHSFDREIEEKIRSGETDFRLGQRMEVEGDQIDYFLNFHVDKEARKAYLNDTNVALKVPEQGEERRHTFPRYLRITAKEAYNLLKYGETTAVQKTLFNKKGEKYLSYINLDLNGNKDAKNNYPLKQYHENYYKEKPFILKKAINELPVQVKELESPVTRDFILNSLKRGNRQQVTIYNKGVVETGYLMVNAKAGQIATYDSSMQVIQGKVKEEKSENNEMQESAPDQTDIKKKPGSERKPNWGPKQSGQMKI